MQQPEPGSRLLSSLFNEIERGSIKVPQFQREFVWTKEKSARLLDSLIKGYPIGTFILWRTKEELRSIRNLGGVDLPPTPKGDSVQYVLDGQQRLTSLFASLKGLKVVRSGKTEDFREMFVDLEAGPEEILVFTERPEQSTNRCVPITDLMNMDFDELRIPALYRERIKELKGSMQGYLCSVIVVPEAEIDTATEIFTRINVTGKPLSVFEVMVAKTYDYEQDFDLAEKSSRLIEELADHDYGTVPDIVLLQVSSAIMTKECAKKDILQLNKQAFIDTWETTEDAIRSAVDYLRASFGIPVSQLLPYKALLVPLAYFFAKHPDPPAGLMHDRLRDFFWRVSLGGRYSYSLETRLAQDIKRIDTVLEGKRPEYDYPVNPTSKFVQENGAFNTGRSFIKAILCCLASKKPKSFNNNAEVIINNDWLKRANSKNYHHFFPKGSFQGDSASDERINHIANITIVDEYLNKRVIRAKRPSEYIGAFLESNSQLGESLHTHLIDLNGAGVLHDDFDGFFVYRCEAIAQELARGLIPQEVDQQLQAPNRDDFEDFETSQRLEIEPDEE